MEKPAAVSWVRRILRWGFVDSEEEKLYEYYTNLQKEGAVPRMLLIGTLLQIFATFVPGDRGLTYSYTSVMVGLVCNCLLSALHSKYRPGRNAFAHITLLALWAQLLVTASRRVGDSYNELLGWAIVIQYFTASALPFHPTTQIFYNAMSLIAYIFVMYYNALMACENYFDLDFSHQVHSISDV